MSLLALPTTLSPTVEGTSQVVETRIRRTDFGNGYSQRCGDGINCVKQMWTTEWAGNKTEIIEYYDFFEARKGYEAFTWIPPWESSSIKVICNSWSETFQNGITSSDGVGTLVAEFEQVFDLD